MALTIKHKEDGSFYEMGDTQSFVSVDMPIYSVGAIIPADYWNATYEWIELPQTRWTCNEDGKYLLIARFNFGGTGSEIVEAGSFYKNGSLTYNPVQGIRPGLEHSNYCQIYNLVAGDVMSIGVSKKAQGPKGTTNSAELQIVQLQKSVPDIIANKGALVSGGAFQFDIDGNCYTENYSTDEVKVGKWIDGKPLYQKCYQNLSIPNPTSYGDRVIDTLPDALDGFIFDQQFLNGADNNWYPSRLIPAQGYEMFSFRRSSKELVFGHNWSQFIGYSAILRYTKDA